MSSQCYQRPCPLTGFAVIGTLWASSDDPSFSDALVQREVGAKLTALQKKSREGQCYTNASQDTHTQPTAVVNIKD